MKQYGILFSEGHCIRPTSQPLHSIETLPDFYFNGYQNNSRTVYTCLSGYTFLGIDKQRESICRTVSKSAIGYWDYITENCTGSRE